VLCADGALHRHTCATLLRAGVNVVGIVVCTRPGIRARLHFLRRWLQRHGPLRTSGQILGRVYDRFKNRRQDGQLFSALLDEASDRRTLAEHQPPTFQTDSYSRPDTLTTLRGLDPDIFIVHTKFIVGPSVLRVPAVAVIGGHPGVTPHYRGAYSPFWALMHGKPEMVGFTVFLLDAGIDTGPILHQAVVPITPEDSHLTLAWKGVLQQAEVQAAAVKRLDAGECLPMRPIRSVPENSYFGPPTLRDFWRYRRKQRVVR
jgi:folate-dependent phosphoribosylglycinamide formyltransferase PurN